MAKPKAKYLNGFRRELVLWVLSLQLILENHREHFRGKELTWLDSIILSIENLSKLMLGDLDLTEIKTIENAINQIEPKLYAEKLINSSKPTVKVSIDLIYDLAELALENCRYDCNKDFDTCPRRKMFLDLLIPPFREDGSCQYYRGED